MENTESRVTIHMAASLDGFIARKDGSVGWLETSDNFEGGDTMAPESVVEFLRTIDCYVMGSRTYETALDFESKGLGWAYGDKPTFVLTSRELRKTRDTVELYSVMPILIGKGISFFDRLEKDVALHLAEAKAYKNGMLALRYEVKP